MTVLPSPPPKGQRRPAADRTALPRHPKRITAFGLAPGDRLTHKYEIAALLGTGWEGEVYIIRERKTGIERAAKLFYPHRNLRNRAARFYARKLHKLRHCSALIQYHTEETVLFEGIPVTVLVAEYVEGEPLSDFVRHFPEDRLPPFVALHLLYALACALEEIHLHDEYHGDLHSDNILVSRFGLEFELKLLDPFHWPDSKSANQQYDICALIRLFYDALGGAAQYRLQPAPIKYICCGLKQGLILGKFRTMSQLRQHLETMQW